MTLFRTTLAVSNTFIEWIEYSLYLFLSPTLSKQFFPVISESAGLIMTYGLFATAYFFRPLGALLFGYFSDRLGRKPPMIFAILLMGVATLGMGTLPTYASVGMLAPALLLFFRILQSIAVSGEYQSSAIYLMEHSPKPFSGALIIAASAGGMCVGGSIVSLLSHYAVSDTHWRWPFLIVGALALILALFRFKLAETPVFREMQSQHRIQRNPITALMHYPIPMLRIVLTSIFVCVFVYTCNGYYAAYLAKHTTLGISTAYVYCSLCELGVALFAPLIAFFWGEKHNTWILRLGAIGMALTAPWMFFAAQADNHSWIAQALILFTVFDALVTASIAYFLFLQLPPTIRCTGVGLGWNFSAAFFGGTAPMVAQKLVSAGYPLGPGYLVSGAAILALSAIKEK